MQFLNNNKIFQESISGEFARYLLTSYKLLIANFSSFLTNIGCTFEIAIKGTINFYDNDEANRCIFYSHLLLVEPKFEIYIEAKSNHLNFKSKRRK